MKTLLFICGANGIGKTTICRALVEKREHTAYVDSDPCRLMNPFVLDDVTIPLIASNISTMIRNYLLCPYVDTVVFSYGFHGRRREVFDLLLQQLSDLSYRFVPVLLECEEEENIRRMKIDRRDIERIRRGISLSRKAIENVSYPRVDISDLSVDQTCDALLPFLDN